MRLKRSRRIIKNKNKLIAELREKIEDLEQSNELLEFDLYLEQEEGEANRNELIDIFGITRYYDNL